MSSEESEREREEEEEEEGEDQDSSVEASEEEEEEEEEIIEKKVLPQRATRGNRIHKLLEEDEADKDFYGQSYFQESSGDEEFEQEGVEVDIPDADFFEALSEGSSSDEEEKERRQEREEKKRTKKKGVYVDPQRKIKKSKVEQGEEEEDLEKEKKPRKEKPGNIRRSQTHLHTDRVLRVTTRDETLSRKFVRQEQEQIKKAKPRKERREAPVITQEQRLQEAKITEMHNIQSLSYLEALEQQKKKVEIKKEEIVGPRISFHSKNNTNTLTFYECSPYKILDPRAPPRIRIFNSLMKGPSKSISVTPSLTLKLPVNPKPSLTQTTDTK